MAASARRTTYLFNSSGIRLRGNGVVTGAGRDVTTGIEIFEGTPFADRMRGSDRADDLRGVAGQDIIRGGPGTTP